MAVYVRNRQMVLYGCEVNGGIAARKRQGDGAVFLKRCNNQGILLL